MRRVAYVDFTSDKPWGPADVPASQSSEASVDQIKAAIAALSRADLYRLEKYARYRMRGLGRKADGRDYEDLLKEAMLATLSGDRKWKEGSVEFPAFLMGVMRSLSSHWREKVTFENNSFRSDGIDATQPAAEINALASEVPDAERVLSAKEEWASIRNYFKSDDRVSAALDGFSQGWEGSDLRVRFRWSQTEYETVMKRLRRGLMARARQERSQ